MYLIAVTGGIAAGKSTVSARLAELGAKLISADQVAREVVAPGTPGLAELVQKFGADILQPDGSLDRAKLANLVFHDSAALTALNNIVHPAVAKRTSELFAEAEACGEPILVYEIPLLVESENRYPFDLIVTVEASPATQIDRMQQYRGMSEHEAYARLHSQSNASQRIQIADVVLNSNGTLAETLAQTDTLWQQIQETLSKR